MRLVLGGQVCEQIDETTVLMTLWDCFKPHVRTLNDSMLANPRTADDTYIVLPTQQGRKILLELPFGLLNQQRGLPLHILSHLVIEMTLGDIDNAMAGTGLDWELRDVCLTGTCLHVDSQHNLKIPRAH